MKELIERQAVNKLIREYFDDNMIEDGDWHSDGLIRELRDLPSVHSEPLTDKEQRIFLAAMGRETKICEAVDKEMDEEFPVPYAYDVSLTSVCREIKRKVKGALWTN